MKIHLMTALLLPMGLLGWALAQTPPATQPAQPTTRPLSTEKVFENMLKPVDSPGLIIQPITGDRLRVNVSTGVGAVAPNAPAINLLREGSSIADRTGRLTKTADGKDWAFAFEADGKTLQDPPMLLLPNLNLEAMEDATASGTHEVRFRVSGVVSEYHGHNYLLVQTVKMPPDVTQQF